MPDIDSQAHSTTAAMDLTLILSQEDPWLLRLGAYLTAINPLVKVVLPSAQENSRRLRSICGLGMTVEVGAIAHGTFDAAWFEKTEALIYSILDYVDYWNNNQTINYPEIFTFFRCIQSVSYPKNAAGEIIATIHPQLLAQDYQPLNPHEPMFLGRDRTTVIPYLGKQPVYPIFIAETSYVEKNIAMVFTRKQTVNVNKIKENY